MSSHASVRLSAGALPTHEATSRVNWRRIYLATFAAIFVIEGILVYYQASLITPLVLLILLLVFARPSEKLRFVRDFGPLVLVLFVYYSMWGSADDFGRAVRIMPQIDAERFLFHGHIPTIVMQNALYDPNHAHWYDFVAVAAHLSHFVFPALFAGIVWQHRRDMHWQFMSAFILLSYAGFVTFLLMPSAPPWFAAQHGYIDQVYLVHRTVPGLSRVYSDLSANPVAAIPSLHAAFPWLIYLFSLKIWGRRALPVILYPMIIWWGIVYSGHHYVVDAIAGVAYASAAYYVVTGHPYRLAQAFGRALLSRTAAPTTRPAHSD